MKMTTLKRILQTSENPVFVTVLILFVALVPMNTRAAGMKGPPGIEEISPPGSSQLYQTSTTKLIGKGLIKAYSTFISPADGPRSPSYPTSTAYGQEAIEQHGFLIGVILIADRLLHEADIHRGPVIRLYGTDRYYDPLENNTFWWDDNCHAQ